MDFASALQSTFGPDYLWVPANRRALARLPMDRADREVIRAQVEWTADPPKTPATYIVERGISDLWNAVVLSGVPLRVAVDRMKTTADREIRRKLEEFSYLRDGVLVKSFTVATAADIAARVQRHAAP